MDGLLLLVRFVRSLIFSFGEWRPRRDDKTGLQLGRRDKFFFVPTELLSIYSLFFLSCARLFHSCCSHAKVFGKTLVHEFHISNSNVYWIILPAFGKRGDRCWGRRFTCQKPKIIILITSLFSKATEVYFIMVKGLNPLCLKLPCFDHFSLWYSYLWVVRSAL